MKKIFLKSYLKSLILKKLQVHYFVLIMCIIIIRLYVQNTRKFNFILTSANMTPKPIYLYLNQIIINFKLLIFLQEKCYNISGWFI